MWWINGQHEWEPPAELRQNDSGNGRSFWGSLPAWHKKRTGGQDYRLLIFWEKLLFSEFSSRELRLLSSFGSAYILIFIFNITSWLPMQIVQSCGTDPSPCQGTGLSSFHHWPLGLSSVDPRCGLAGDIALGSKPLTWSFGFTVHRQIFYTLLHLNLGSTD